MLPPSVVVCRVMMLPAYYTAPHVANVVCCVFVVGITNPKCANVFHGMRLVNATFVTSWFKSANCCHLILCTS